jgi:hypothetical protein
MKTFLFVAILLTGCAMGPVSTGARQEPVGEKCPSIESLTHTQQQLLGTWKHVELIRVIDGHRLSPQPISGENIGRFYCNGTWDLRGPNYRSAGTFRWVGKDAIEQTVVESNLAIQIGLVTLKRIIVDERRLEIQIEQTPAQRAQVMPPPKAGIRQDIATLVITKFDRLAK